MTHSREIKSFDHELVKSVVKNIHFRARLKEFANESNRISGITNPEENEKMFNKLDAFLKLEKLTVENVCDFNEWGELRDKEGIAYLFVCGISAKYELKRLIVDKNLSPYFVCRSLIQLNYFTFGNGRTARAIWLWQMVNQHDYDLSRGFLHEFYYQSLRG